MQRRLDVRLGVICNCQADAYHLVKLPFKMDVKVLFKTIASVIKRDNTYVAPNEEAEKKAKEAVEAGKK